MPEPKLLMLHNLLNCHACPIRASVPMNRVVPGYGVWPSKIMIVAQSPGEDERKLGKPLVGKSGQLLAQLCKRAGFDLDAVFRTNINLCRPENNRKATAAEIKACRHWLDDQIEVVDPDVIITLGDSAFKSFLPDETSSITQIAGNVYEREVNGRMRFILPTIHPAFVARNEQAYAATLVDHLRIGLEVSRNGYDKKQAEAIPFRKHVAEWSEILEVANGSRSFGLDLETDGNRRDSGIIGIGLCDTPGNGLYYPFRDFDADEGLAQIKEAIESTSRRKVVSNAKFERHILHHYGVTMRHYFDTLLEAWLLGTVPLGLKDAFHQLFGIEMIHIDKFAQYKQLDWRGKSSLDMLLAQDKEFAAVVEYAAQDPDASLRVHNVLYPLLQERGLISLYEDLELPFGEAIFEMEEAGFKLDPEALREPEEVLHKILNEFYIEIMKLTGWPSTRKVTTYKTKPDKVEIIPFNAGSWQQKTKLLWEEDQYHGAEWPHPYKLPTPKRVKGKIEYKTDKISLGEHIGNPVVRAVLAWNGADTLLSSVEGLPTWVDPKTGRIHCDIKQRGTETGRVSTGDPNMQNISSHEREDVKIGMDGSVIRRAFVAEPGNYLFTPDLSQIEMRFAAHLSGDEVMIRLLTEGADMHANTARTVYRKDESDVTPAEWKNMRFLSKTANFGSLYGLQGPGLIRRTPSLKLTIEEANAFIQGIYTTYPQLRSWQLSVMEFTRRHGYAETILGRRRYLPDITASDFQARGEAERAAINVPIQGSAADYFKICIIRVREALQQRPHLRTRLIMQVHDEIVMEGPKHEAEELASFVPDIMSHAITLEVPVKVDFEYGENWKDLKKWTGVTA